MKDKLNITNICIKDQGITYKFRLYNTINDAYYIINKMYEQNHKIKEQIQEIDELYWYGDIGAFEKDSLDFLKLHMFYQSVYSEFNIIHLISDKIALEVQRNVLTIKVTSIDELDNIVLLSKDKYKTNLKELYTLIQMTYTSTNVVMSFDNIKLVYDIDDIIKDYRIIIFVTELDRVMVQLYHKDYIFPEEDNDDYRKYENPLGPILDATFKYLSLKI